MENNSNNRTVENESTGGGPGGGNVTDMNHEDVHQDQLGSVSHRQGEFFDKYFIHGFIGLLHVFFIILGAWMDRWDLVIVGIIAFVISIMAFNFSWISLLKEQNK